MDNTNPNYGIAMIIYMTIFAPMIEEVIFRKLLIKLLSFLGQWTAIIISSILFELGHLYSFLTPFLSCAFAIILAIIAQKYGTIKYGVIVHIIINFASGIIDIYIVQVIYIIFILLSIINIKKDYKELFSLKSI